jgi:hypothetical protein
MHTDAIAVLRLSDGAAGLVDMHPMNSRIVETAIRAKARSVGS